MVIHLGLRCDIGTVNGTGFVKFQYRKSVDCDTNESYRARMLYCIWISFGSFWYETYNLKKILGTVLCM
jgi:hypothetical protein